MFKTGKIQLVLSEDSDLIAYGVTKMINQWQITRGMTLRYVDMERLNRVAMLNDSRLSNVEKYFVDNPERRNRVILLVLAAGCDYVGKVKGIGYTTALKILKAEGGPNQYASVIERLIQSKQPEDIPQHYLKRFEQALVVFEYQLAYDEARKEAVYWNEGIEEDSIAARHPDRRQYLGAQLSTAQARDIAEGRLIARTGQTRKLPSPRAAKSCLFLLYY